MLNVYSKPLTSYLEIQKHHQEEFRQAKFIPSLWPKLEPICSQIFSSEKLSTAGEAFALARLTILNPPTLQIQYVSPCYSY